MTANRSFSKGMIAGFVATIVLSALMLMKAKMGLMPQLNPIKMMTTMMGASTPAAGWIAHFLIGTVLWGLLFAWVAPRLPGATWWRGLLFSIGPWLLMMIALMPMAGAGFFGVGLGIGAPVITLMMHLIYGAVLGGVYGALVHGVDVPPHHTQTTA
jgi:hypothetical protein